MTIYDRARNRFFENDSSLAVLTDALEMTVFPDDLFYALLLKAFTCAAVDSIDMRGNDGDWDISGLWRGRRIALSGRGDEGVQSFELCSRGGTVCYIIRYSYSGGQKGIKYPKRITMTGERGDKRVSLEIIEIKEDIDESELLELSSSGGRNAF
jgi:hypothetical protein